MSELIVAFDEEAARNELKELVKRTIEDTSNAFLEEEADDPIKAERCERAVDCDSVPPNVGVRAAAHE